MSGVGLGLSPGRRVSEELKTGFTCSPRSRSARPRAPGRRPFSQLSPCRLVRTVQGVGSHRSHWWVPETHGEEDCILVVFKGVSGNEVFWFPMSSSSLFRFSLYLLHPGTRGFPGRATKGPAHFWW